MRTCYGPRFLGAPARDPAHLQLVWCSSGALCSRRQYFWFLFLAPRALRHAVALLRFAGSRNLTYFNNHRFLSRPPVFPRLIQSGVPRALSPGKDDPAPSPHSAAALRHNVADSHTRRAHTRKTLVFGTLAWLDWLNVRSQAGRSVRPRDHMARRRTHPSCFGVD